MTGSPPHARPGPDIAASTREPVVDGYPARPGVRAGDTLRLHVSTRADRFRMDVYRCGETLRHMAFLIADGRHAPARRPEQDWCWPGYDFAVPAKWPSGVYVAILRADADGPPDPAPDSTEAVDARAGRMLFVVTPRVPTARILYKVPVFTYHAYNESGGGSLYRSTHHLATPPPGGTRIVGLRRPGGGIGGPVKGHPDAHDPRTPRQTFAHWDAPFIAWLEANGHTVDYCTDLDLHESPEPLDGHRLLLSAGHDEYWSAPTRRHVTAFRDRGGNIANFGANTCWWRVTVTDDGTALACTKFPPGAPLGVDLDALRGVPDHWWETEPENTLTGVSYRNGGGHWLGPRAPLGFTVQHAQHPIFTGTGLRDGDLLGAEHALVGYECDGAATRRDASGAAVATGEDGTPVDFTILGVAELPADPAAGWHHAARESDGCARMATLGLYTRGGTVFTAATVDWPRVLPLDRQVRTITHNVITMLSRNPGPASCGPKDVSVPAEPG
ncbi:N,N-dimethylformamidase beta subunit family domain-containing protein [Embleya sp. NPDC127516]|uniref:N,N-dimethylformamidase beta subunit family domain-containing protein n=1 Tax=Embleya sp. NPDC127516 TaxID=3363990 RepID=UPI00382209E8